MDLESRIVKNADYDFYPHFCLINTNFQPFNPDMEPALLHMESVNINIYPNAVSEHHSAIYIQKKSNNDEYNKHGTIKSP